MINVKDQLTASHPLENREKNVSAKNLCYFGIYFIWAYVLFGFLVRKDWGAESNGIVESEPRFVCAVHSKAREGDRFPYWPLAMFEELEFYAQCTQGNRWDTRNSRYSQQWVTDFNDLSGSFLLICFVSFRSKRVCWT